MARQRWLDSVCIGVISGYKIKKNHILAIYKKTFVHIGARTLDLGVISTSLCQLSYANNFEMVLVVSYIYTITSTTRTETGPHGSWFSEMELVWMRNIIFDITQIQIKVLVADLSH